jgi:hypothetical protein
LSEEGPEQAFTSLDAQRGACAAFILSQKHEGWTVLPTFYNDGGFSGGTMDCPALKLRSLTQNCAPDSSLDSRLHTRNSKTFIDRIDPVRTSASLR